MNLCKQILVSIFLFVIIPTTFAQTQNALKQTFKDACAISVYTCFELERPKVIFLPLKEGTNGIYIAGHDAIYINSDIMYKDPLFIRSVIVHETVHYLQFTYGYLYESCRWEAEAFAISNFYVTKEGRNDLRENDWREHYRCNQ